MKWLPIIGLFFNVIGSVLFIVDTNRLSSQLASMVKRIAEDHGKYDSRRFTEPEIGQLQTRIVTSKRLTFLGYIFFLSGFGLQLISYLQ